MYPEMNRRPFHTILGQELPSHDQRTKIQGAVDKAWAKPSQHGEARRTKITMSTVVNSRGVSLWSGSTQSAYTLSGRRTVECAALALFTLSPNIPAMKGYYLLRE